MTSEIRTNTLTSRAGLSTVTMTDSGPMFSGITTFVDNSGFTFGVGAGSSIFTPASNTLTFGTNSNERFRIDSDGRLIIGGGSSRAVGFEHRLQLEDTNDLPHSFSMISNRPNAFGVHLSFAKSRGSTRGSNTIVQDNDELATLVFRGADGTDLGTIGAMIDVRVDGTPASNQVPASFEFHTRNSSGALAQRLIINSAGHLMPGADSVYNIGSSSVRYANIYADTLYGDGSNLTGITGTTINGNTDHYVVTATGTANTLQGESSLTYDGNQLNVIQTTSSSDSKVVIANSNTPGSGALRLEFQYGTGTTEGTNRYRFGYVEGYRQGGSNDGGLIFGTKPSNAAAPTERLRINSSGKLFLHGTGATGSNDTSTLLPAGLSLNIHGTTSSDGISVVRYSGSYGAYGLNIGRSRNDTFGTNTAVQSGDELGHVTFYGADGTDFDYAAQITGLCDGAVGTSGDATDMPGALSFRTSPEGSASPEERMKIRSDGKVVIGTNYTGGTLSVSGNIITDDGTNGRVTIQADGTSTNQILSTTTGFGSYCNMKYQAAAHIFQYGGNQTFRINDDGTFRGKPDQVNGRDTNTVLGGKSFKYTTSNISPSWGSGSNGWYSFYQMYDGVYTFWLNTAAHSSICFSVSKGYTGSQKSFITVHHFINNANGNYGNVKGIRVTTDGIIQVYIHASASNQHFEMYVQAAGGDLTNMTNFYSTLTKETGSPSINDSWGTSDAYSPSRGAHTTDGVCSPKILHNRQEMSCFATSTSLYGANTAGSKGFYWDPGTASCQSSSPRNTGWSSYYINKHDGNGGAENRYIDFWLNNGQLGSITISGSGLNYGGSSDYRLKENVVNITDGISRVKQLQPRRFNWISDETNTAQDGFIAHEVQSIIPYAVTGTKDQVVTQEEFDANTQPEDKEVGTPIYQQLDYGKITPLLTAAIKELITKVETLEQENIALQGSQDRIEKLEAKVVSLEKKLDDHLFHLSPP